MGFILTTTNLTKTYGKKDAAKDINIHVREGEIYGLIGRNGAGKTTVMRVISGLSKATSGSYELFGENKFGVGVLIESPGIYPTMSAEENIRLKCIALGCNNRDYIQSLLKTVGLEKVGDPKMIVLDEPINGLDPQGIVEVRKTLERLKNEKGITIMISSHILDELSKLADSYGIIHEGRLLDEFTTEELTDRCGRYVTVRTDDNSRALEVLQAAGFTNSVIDDNKDIRVDDAIHQTIEMNSILVNAGIGVKELLIKNTSLEDYYLSVTGGKHNG